MMRTKNKVLSENDSLQNDKFRWLADNSADIIHVLDDKGIVTYINPAVTRILGYTQEEMVGKNAFAYIHPYDHQRITQAFRKTLVSTSKTRILEMQIRHKNGNWVTFEVVSKPVVTHSGEVNLVINSRDITKRKQLEMSKNEFLSLVAHELKTPLTVIKLVIQTLGYKCKEYNVAREILKKLKDVDAEMNRLTSLINEILDFSKFESGIVELNITQFSLNDLIKETISELKLIAKQRINFTKQAKILINADRDKIKQTLINLISNSIKYSKRNGRIFITSEISKGLAIVSVKDEGAGIPKDKLLHIFDRFFQVENASKLGTGLGLYITKEIISKHKGEVWVESEEGKGSTFFFSLPLSKV